MIGYYNYTVILTYIGAISGFVGIMYIMGDNLKIALICLMFSGFCDMFDGKIASTMHRTKQEKRFGIQIDSLSDLICFGVLPALIIFQCSNGKFLHILISAAYLLCALIRLAWFNIDEEERQDQEEKNRETYFGLPVTTIALLLPLFIGVMHLLKLPVYKLSSLLLLCIALAFISPFYLKKPRTLGKIIMILCGLVGLTLILIGGNI